MFHVFGISLASISKTILIHLFWIWIRQIEAVQRHMFLVFGAHHIECLKQPKHTGPLIYMSYLHFCADSICSKSTFVIFYTLKNPFWQLIIFVWSKYVDCTFASHIYIQPEQIFDFHISYGYYEKERFKYW